MLLCFAEEAERILIESEDLYSVYVLSLPFTALSQLSPARIFLLTEYHSTLYFYA